MHARGMRTRLRMATVIGAAGIALIGGVIGAAPAAFAAPASAPARDWTPIAGSIGWSRCAPITWSTDPGVLPPPVAARQRGMLEWAFAQWSRVSGLRFAYVGNTGTDYVPGSQDLRPLDGVDRGRHVYLTWLGPRQAPALGGRTSGFGAPSRVSGGEIIGGRAVFKASYVRAMTHDSPARVRALYLHEIGHILGLGHAASRGNRMYPIVDRATRLGAGDIAGVRALTRGC